MNLHEGQAYQKQESVNIQMEFMKLNKKALYLIAQVLDVSEAWLMGHDVPMERLLYEKNAAETKLLEQIQCSYGKKVVQLLELFNQLNAAGQDKAPETLTDLTMIEKYTEK